jgi:hypothetical protein
MCEHCQQSAVVPFAVEVRAHDHHEQCARQVRCDRLGAEACAWPPPPRVVAQDEEATLSFAIEASVPDEVQDMIFPAAQFSLQHREPRVRQPLQPHLAAADGPRQGLVQP